MPSEVESFLGVRSADAESATPTQRYPGFRAIVAFLRGLALFYGIVAILVIIVGLRQRDAILYVVVGVVGGSICVIGSLLWAEIILVFRDIEENTRHTYYAVFLLNDMLSSASDALHAPPEAVKQRSKWRLFWQRI
jgi:hypothetical protein